MFTKHISAVVLVIAVAAAALVTASFAAPKAPQASDDFALRHLSGLAQPASALPSYYAGSDYALRRWSSGVDTSDYALRHVASGIDTSDFGLRHPEWMAAPVVDTSDYALRHMTTGIDSSDYFLRHPEFLSQ